MYYTLRHTWLLTAHKSSTSKPPWSWRLDCQCHCICAFYYGYDDISCVYNRKSGYPSTRVFSPDTFDQYNYLHTLSVSQAIEATFSFSLALCAAIYTTFEVNKPGSSISGVLFLAVPIFIALLMIIVYLKAVRRCQNQAEGGSEIR